VSRLAQVVLGGTLALLGGGVLFYWLVSAPSTPSRDEVDGLSDSATVSWTQDHLTTVAASGPLDALTALGYAHGLKRGWTVTLWRQTALGRLSAWFGTGPLPIDRHARRLGFGQHARAAYKALPGSTQRRLQAYSHGLNSALQSDHVRGQAPFVLLDVTPARWKPWHVLVVERLLAWLATDLLDAPPNAPPAFDAFRRADQQLRRWLHLHGWKRSVAWAVRPESDSSAATLFQRHVLGSTALPVVQEVRIRLDDAATRPIQGATLPGAPLFPTGSTPERAWAVLLGSAAHLERVAPDPSSSSIRWHERISPQNADERVVTVRRRDGALLFSPPNSVDADSDSTWVLRWAGFSNRSDIATWLRTSGLFGSPEPTSFSLFEGNGLSLTRDGTWRVRGRPPVVVRNEASGSILIGRSPWAAHQAERLMAHGPASPSTVEALNQDDSSTWAGALHAAAQPALAPLAGDSSLVGEALPYVQNWNHRYEPSSIGASLFEHWMRAYRRDLGALPTPSDTSYFADHRRRQAFRRAVDTLRTRLGPDPRRWRWGDLASSRRFVPVWSADSLVADDLSDLATSRYAPIEEPGRGHASTLAGGPAFVDSLPMGPAPTTWDGWLRPSDTAFTTRRPRFNPEGAFSRWALPSASPPPVSFSEDTEETQVHLVPPER